MYFLAKSLPRVKKKLWEWRDHSVIKGTGCSSRGREFNSQQPHGDSKSSIMGSGDFFCPADLMEDRVLIYINK